MSLIGNRYVTDSDPGAVGLGYQNIDYWTGFLMADGCLSNDGKVIQCRITSRDRSHLQRLKRDLLVKTKIIDIPNVGLYGMSLIKFRNKDLHSMLMRSGVVPRKTFANTTTDKCNSRDFWRGMIDGDGMISIRRKDSYPIIKLVGGSGILEQFVAFCRSIGIKSKMNIRKTQSKYCQRVEVFGKSDCVKLIECLYFNSNVSLDRKAESAINILSMSGEVV